MKMFKDYDHYCEHIIAVSADIINMSEPMDFTATTTIDAYQMFNRHTPEWNNYILLF